LHFLFEQLLAGELDVAILVELLFALPKSIVDHVLWKEPLLYMMQAEVAGANLLNTPQPSLSSAAIRPRSGHSKLCVIWMCLRL
jgi:DNA-binding transcriptional LysR family regulator